MTNICGINHCDEPFIAYICFIIVLAIAFFIIIGFSILTWIQNYSPQEDDEYAKKLNRDCGIATGTIILIILISWIFYNQLFNNCL